ncbi:transposase [Methylobacter sp. sgz302048]|uniref:transposase n=1 Tax=Methylobacter sp. sgz302048 TaxID=3455945 RepID=UPI003F9F8C2E
MSLRQVINAILYVLKTGCQWRQLPREFPVWTAVYYYFSRWSCNGTWKRLHHLLRARLREKGGRHKHPTAGCLDSQSVKCTAVSGVRGESSRPQSETAEKRGVGWVGALAETRHGRR